MIQFAAGRRPGAGSGRGLDIAAHAAQHRGRRAAGLEDIEESGWNYISEYRGDVASSLAALRQREFDEPDSYWRRELALWKMPIPATLDELFTEPYGEFLGTNGTHSIIDVDFDGFEPLGPADLVDTFGTEQPDRATFEPVAGEHFRNLYEFLPGRWYGCYVVLYQDDAPTEIAFWGFSGD